MHGHRSSPKDPKAHRILALVLVRDLSKACCARGHRLTQRSYLHEQFFVHALLAAAAWSRARHCRRPVSSCDAEGKQGVCPSQPSKSRTSYTLVSAHFDASAQGRRGLGRPCVAARRPRQRHFARPACTGVAGHGDSRGKQCTTRSSAPHLARRCFC